jgi:hypothetical protein
VNLVGKTVCGERAVPTQTQRRGPAEEWKAMNHESTRAIRTWLNPRVYVVLFAAAVGVGFFWIDYLPQPSRMLWLERIHAHPIISADPVRYRDLKTVLAGIECDRAGMNAYVTCPCGAKSLGFKDVPFNYPAATLWLGRLAPVRLSVADGDWLGPVVGIAFLLALSFVFQGTALWGGGLFLRAHNLATRPAGYRARKPRFSLVLSSFLKHWLSR